MLALQTEKVLLTSLEECQNISIIEMTKELKKIEDQRGVVQRLCEEEGESISPSIHNLASSVSIMLTKSKSLLEETIESFCDLCEYLGEDKAPANLEVICGQLLSMIHTILGSARNAIQRLQRKEDGKKRAAAARAGL